MSKQLAFEQREMESYDNMPTFNEVMTSHKKPELSPLQAVNKISELRESLTRIQAKINTLKIAASDNIFAFENPFNAPLSVCIEMINSPQTPYFYISPLVKSECIKRPGYHGEEYRGKTCVRNPVFNWDSEYGKTLKYKEKKFYEFE